MLELLNQIKEKKEKSIFEMSEEEFNEYSKQSDLSSMHSPRSKFMMQSSTPRKSFNVSEKSQKQLQNVHDPSRPILLRHFIDLIIRVAVIKYGDVENLGQIMEKLLFDKIFYQLDKQKQKIQSQTGSNQNNSNSNPSQVKSSSVVNMSYLEDNDVSGKYKKAQEALASEIQFIFDQICQQNKSEKYGFIDKTCKVKDFYKMLINAGYIKDLSDKHIIFHVVERTYDPQSLISNLDLQLKQQEKNGAKKNKNSNIKLKKYIDKQKQLKLIVMLESEIIQFEMSELLLSFLCRKDRDMGHTKNDENFKKKLLVHLQKIQNSLKQKKQQKEKPESQQNTQLNKKKRVWVRTLKDEQKEELAKERVIKNKKLQEEQREKDLKMKEAKERILMQKEDFNVPDINEEEFEDFDESEIEVYDDDYLANF